MSHLQLSRAKTAQPPWLKGVNLVAGGAVMAIAGVMNIFTQIGLANRIPDWADFAVLLPIACWLYAALSTVNWAASPHKSTSRSRAFKGVLMSAGIMELMNVGEHAWVYIEDHGKIDFGFVPIFLVGSVPTLLDVLSVHLIASVLSDHDLPEPAEISEPAPSGKPDLSEPPVLSEPAPSGKPAPLPEDPAPKPLPKRDPAPELPTQPLPEPNDDESTEQKDFKMSAKRQARERVIDDIARMVAEKLADGRSVDEVKKELTGPVLESMFPDVKYDVRSWQNHRNKALDRVAASQGAA